VLELAEKLGRLPQDVVVWAIEGATSNSNADMSPEMVVAIPKLVDQIANDLYAATPPEVMACTNNR